MLSAPPFPDVATSWDEPFDYAPGPLSGQGPWIENPENPVPWVQASGEVHSTTSTGADNIALDVIPSLDLDSPWEITCYIVPAKNMTTGTILLSLIIGDVEGQFVDLHFIAERSGGVYHYRFEVQSTEYYDQSALIVDANLNTPHVIRFESDAPRTIKCYYDGGIVLTFVQDDDYEVEDKTFELSATPSANVGTVNVQRLIVQQPPP